MGRSYSKMWFLRLGEIELWGFSYWSTIALYGPSRYPTMILCLMVRLLMWRNGFIRSSSLCGICFLGGILVHPSHCEWKGEPLLCWSRETLCVGILLWLFWVLWWCCGCFLFLLGVVPSFLCLWEMVVFCFFSLVVLSSSFLLFCWCSMCFSSLFDGF